MAQFWSSPETFRVKEIPAYEPSGTGSHVYAWIEKSGLTTPEAIRALANAVGVEVRDVGYGGLKDKHAVTQQWLSFPEAAASALTTVELAGLKVLSTSRHGNKLRVGHVRSNEFEVTLTKVTPAEGQRIGQEFDRIVAKGVPNRYGQQRFGRGDNVAQGLGILNGTWRERDRRKRTLLISAVQSAVFNQVLAWRAEQNSLRRVMTGDVLQKSGSGGLFTSTDASVDQARLDAGEVHTTGPLPGVKTPQAAPGSEAAALEQEAAMKVGLTPELIAQNGRDLPGARRPLVLEVERLAPAEMVGEDRLTLRFGLPAGAYATVVVEAVLSGAGALAPS